MAQKMRIDFSKNPSGIVLLDTSEIISHERVKENWELNHDDTEPCPEENSDAWWKEASFLKDIDLDDFKDNLKYADSLGLCLVSGYAGLWDGRYEGGRVMEITDFDSLTKCVERCDDVKVYIDQEGLHVVGYHHDGTNCYLVQPLSKKGEAYWYRHEHQTKEVHDHLKAVKGYLKRVYYYLF